MKKTLLLALAISAAPFAATATELSYSNIEFGYTQNKIHTNDYDGITDTSMQDTRPKGYYLRGSIELGQSPFYLFGGFNSGRDTVTAHSDGSRARLNSTAREIEAGFGYHHALSSSVNLLTEASYGTARLEYNRAGTHVSGRSNGFRLAVGVDSMLTDHLQGWAKVNYTHGHKTGGKAGAELGLQYRFNDTWGIVGKADLVKNNSGYMFGVRASF
ncbi:MAG TPA: outer membrane beta-barrel protein [Pseudoxanthomonas sp.]|jgi:hypothetical protein|nr:outer membrane beta-barrel protein [Pseudoxanthomonas sp.]